MKKNEKKNNHKSRLLLLLLLLLICLCVLSGATYAWFTSNKTVNVADLNVDVRAVNGLEISADAETWGFVIDKDDLINGYDGSKNQLPSIMTAVSTVGELNGGYLNMYDGVVTTSCADGYTASGSVCYMSQEASVSTADDGTVSYTCPDKYVLSGTTCYLYGEASYTLASSLASEGSCYDYDGSGAANTSSVANCSTVGSYFMAFDVFLKVDQESELYLTGNAGVFNTATTDSGIKNTTRVAFLVQGSVDSDVYYNGDEQTQEDGPTIARKLLGADSSDDVIIWEPNYDVHTASGIQSAELFYGITDLSYTNSSQQAYQGVKAEFTDVSLTETNSTLYPDYFASVPVKLATKAENTDRFSTKIVLPAGVTKLRVYYWVEGQDVDTENNASGSSMKLSLEFTID